MHLSVDLTEKVFIYCDGLLQLIIDSLFQNDVASAAGNAAIAVTLEVDVVVLGHVEERLAKMRFQRDFLLLVGELEHKANGVLVVRWRTVAAMPPQLGKPGHG